MVRLKFALNTPRKRIRRITTYLNPFVRVLALTEEFILISLREINIAPANTIGPPLAPRISDKEFCCKRLALIFVTIGKKILDGR